MGARIRLDGRILCAAMHDPEPGDIYIDDGQLYELSQAGAIVASVTHLHVADCPDFLTGDGHCMGEIIGGSMSRLCGDGIWTRQNPGGWPQAGVLDATITDGQVDAIDVGPDTIVTVTVPPSSGLDEFHPATTHNPARKDHP